MDFSFLQPLLTGLATGAVPVGVSIGCFLINKYTVVKISNENELSIRRAAVTEAGKLLGNGAISSPDAVTYSAAKVMADLPHEVTSEGYTHNDIVDMILGAASIAFPPIAAIAPALNIISKASLDK